MANPGVYSVFFHTLYGPTKVPSSSLYYSTRPPAFKIRSFSSGFSGF